MASSSLLLAVVTLAVIVNGAKVPSNWKTCKKSLPPAKYETCMYSAVKGAIEDLILKGAPTLNIPPLDPFTIPAISIGQGTGPVAIDIKMWDIVITPFLPWQLRKLRTSETANYKFGADIAFTNPVMWFSKYEINGKVLVLPINGKGNCSIQLENYRASLDISGVPYTKGGETYLNVTDLLYTFDVDKMHLQFDNLFDGNKQLSDSMNLFLNENWPDILKELKPALTQGLGLSFKNVAAQVLHSVPYSKLFPE